MAIPHEKFTDLEAKIAQIIDILLEVLSECDADGDTPAVGEGIGRYAQQVESIGIAAGANGLVGLQDACVLFSESLVSLGAQARSLNERERELLEEWPMLVMGYLESPDDGRAGEPLVKHLQDPIWNSPLGEEDADVLRSLLTTQPMELPQETLIEAAVESRESVEAVPEVPSEINYEGVSTESVFTLEEDPAVEVSRQVIRPEAETLEMAQESLAESKDYKDAIHRPVMVEEETPVALIRGIMPASQTATAQEVKTLQEPLPQSEYQEEADDKLVVPEEWFAHSEEVSLAAESVEAALESPFRADNEYVAQDTKLALTDEESVTEFVRTALSEGGLEEVEAAETGQEFISEAVYEKTGSESYLPEELLPKAEAEDQENRVSSNTLQGVNQELIEVLCAEILQLSESAAEILNLATAQQSESAIRNEALLSYAEQIERLADASEAVGFAGLQRVCAHINANLLAFASREAAMTDSERACVEAWPSRALDYLRLVTDEKICATLVESLQDHHWPNPLPMEDVAPLIELLMSPDLKAEEVEVEIRQKLAQPEDVSLELPADVNPELLDSLLQELPSQTADFSASVQKLIEGEGTLQDIQVAQRIAHTLKGAANTVGVRGIATLTHQIEDILQALSKHSALPVRTLAETLMNAADCLETMSEALLGLSAPPPQALEVLQEVLDWANRIDREGIPLSEEAIPAETDKPASSKDHETFAGNLPKESEQLEKEANASTPVQQQTPGAAVPMLRIPAPLVDELLRLVGESMILTGQIQERVHKTTLHAQAVRAQNLILQQLTAELEQLVDIQNVISPSIQLMPEGDFDPLELDQYNELHSTSRRLLEAATDSKELSDQIREDIVALNALLVTQGRLHRENQEAVLRTRMVPVSTIIPRLQRSVRQTCRLTDKQVDFHVSGVDTLIDSNVLTDMVDPLMHLLRNAVDHGIEYPEVRRAQGKNPIGRIDLKFGREGNDVVIRCQDDGTGLDMTAIRRTAEHRALVDLGAALSEEELSQLILLPGFSTRTEVTQTSGRGVGMDAVYSRLQELKGSIRIRSETGKGCLIELRLPFTLISTHALLVRAKQSMFALSERGITQILYSGSGKVSRLGKVMTYQVENDIFEASYLESLLNLPLESQVGDSLRPVILVREEMGATRAILVEEILDSRDLVVKNMGDYIPKLKGIVGATILGDGSVAPVLDLPELLRAAPTRAFITPVISRSEAMGNIAVEQHRRALVVDDSLSARRSLAQFMEDAGFEVHTARDGLEAIGIIHAKRPDILLVDLEMPRMNGLELTSHVRANDVTNDLPIIMITSRSTEKHRQEANRVGVNVYLTKPFAEDELLEHVNAILECA